MDAMVGLPGCRRLVGVVLAHLALLVATALLSLSLGATLPASASGTASGMIGLLALPLAVFLSLYVSLSAHSEAIELLWSIKAKQRLKQFALPAIAAGAAFSIAAFASVLALGQPGGLPVVLQLLAFAVPVAGLGLLAVNGLHRYRAMRRGAADMSASLQSAAPEADGLHRVRASFRTEMGSASTNVRPGPQGFTLTGLTSRPFHDPADFDWMRAFEANAGAIQAEAEAALRLNADRVDVYKYPGLQGDKWKAFKFVSRHAPYEDNLAACPVTARLLATIPGYPVFRDAMFSILAPGGEIPPHRDVANIYLTAHLGLSVPEGGFIEVAGQQRAWREQAFTVFDSSYEHRAVNPSNLPRVVLLIDFLHPELTLQETAWVGRVGL